MRNAPIRHQDIGCRNRHPSAARNVAVRLGDWAHWTKKTTAHIEKCCFMTDQCCPKCGGDVYVPSSGREPYVSNWYACHRCGPVDSVPRLNKVLDHGGSILGQAMADAVTQSVEGWE